MTCSELRRHIQETLDDLDPARALARACSDLAAAISNAEESVLPASTQPHLAHLAAQITTLLGEDSTSSPCHLVTPSPCHLVTPSRCHLVTPSPCHPATPTSRAPFVVRRTEVSARPGHLWRHFAPRGSPDH